MPTNNQDKGLPQTPAVESEKIPVLTNNFTPTAPKNPILWGPNQPWVDPSTYTLPTTWRTKELLSIPKVTRLCIGPLGSTCHTITQAFTYIGGLPSPVYDHATMPTAIYCSCDDHMLIDLADGTQVRVQLVDDGIHFLFTEANVNYLNWLFIVGTGPVGNYFTFDTPVNGGACIGSPP